MKVLRFEQKHLYQYLYSLFVLPPDSASLESLFELIGAMFLHTQFLATDGSPFGLGTLRSARLPYVAPQTLDGINSGLPRVVLLFSQILHESPFHNVSSYYASFTFVFALRPVSIASVGSCVLQLRVVFRFAFFCYYNTNGGYG